MSSWMDLCVFGDEVIDKMLTPWSITYLLIWIIGMLGNILNIIIYSCKHRLSKNLSQNTRLYLESRSINFIFWWLAVNDFFKLLIIFLYNWCCGWQIGINFFNRNSVNSLYITVLLLLGSYLLQVFQTTTFGLHMFLAVWRYHYIQYPENLDVRSDIRLLKKIVFRIYVLSFVTGGLSFFIVEMRPITDYAGGETYYQLIYYRQNYFAVLCMIIYEIILRMVLLILLAVISVMLLFAVLKTCLRRRRAGTYLEASRRVLKRELLGNANMMVVAIVFTFIITEMSSILSMMVFFYYGEIIATDKMNFLNFLYILMCSISFGQVQELTLLINSSYNIFFYLLLGARYRKVLKSLLNDIWIFIYGIVTRCISCK